MIFAVVNNKGGVGKTTSVVHLGYALARLGNRVLVIDLDAQANLLGHVFDYAFVEQIKTRQNGKAQAPIMHENAQIDVMPLSFWKAEMKDYQTAIKTASATYDVVLIDCPPSLEYRTEAALYAADYVLVPTEPEKLSIDGIRNLLESLPRYDVQLAGIIITRYNKKKTAHGSWLQALTSMYPRDVIKIPVIDSSVFPSASTMNITGYEQTGRRSNAALEAYNGIAKTVAERFGLNTPGAKKQASEVKHG